MAEIQQSSGNDGKKIRRKNNSTRIDMTPMVDLAFLLLTFFMLTTTFMDPYIIKIVKPDENATEPGPMLDEQKVITVILGANNSVYWYHGITDPKIHRSNFSNSGIRKVLLEKKKEIAGLYILIKPSDKSRYQNMIDILDEMLITEITSYSLLKMTPVDNQLVAEANL